MASIKWEYTLAFIFVVCSVILLVLIVMQSKYAETSYTDLLHEIENEQSAGFTLQGIPNSPISEDTLEEYGELVERPLFFNERRPIIVSEEDAAAVAAAAAAEEEQALEDMTIKLIGIIKIPDNVYALFHAPKAKPDESEFQRYKQGDEISGRTLKEIKTDRVIISSTTGTEEILLMKPRMHRAVRKPRIPKRAKKTNRTNPFNRKKNK